ncbi:hypothetical protein GGX14DRAFT_382491, partial [Mycena pura]
KKGAVVGYKHEEIHLGIYEILVGDMKGLRWVDANGYLNLNVASLGGYRPVEGGRESDGMPLYIAEAARLPRDWTVMKSSVILLI